MAIQWAVENVRVSLFSNAAVQVSDADWTDLTGQTEAETRQAVPGGRIFSGPFEGAQFNLAGTTNRIDLILSCGLPKTGDEPELPIIGQWEAVRDRFVKLTNEWIAREKFPILRIAFGAVLLSRTANKRESYARLKDLLSSVSVSDGMAELLFRINWPTESKSVKGVLINRITQWTAIRLVRRTLQLVVPAAESTDIEMYAVRLEIDHSTDLARSTPFKREESVAMYKELVMMASQNAANGERP